MWKLVVGFIVFAGVALFVINQGGDKLDMSGEKHEVHVSEPAASASVAASEASGTK